MSAGSVFRFVWLSSHAFALALLCGCHAEVSGDPRQGLGADALKVRTNLPSSPSAALERAAVRRRGEPVAGGPEIGPRFANVAASSGIEFTYFNDFVRERFFLPEVMGGGAAWLDFDGDGWLDLYLANGCRLKDPDPVQRDHLNRLYRNIGGTRFEDVTMGSSAHQPGYGQGVAVGDFNSDGFPDLYVANFGPNALLANNGDGTFTDVTGEAGVGDALWGSSAAWLDLDGDADLDLYVVNYLDVSFENYRVCKYNGKTGYCGPGDYEGQPDRVYLNLGDGRFQESAEQLGFLDTNGKGLAVIAADFDHDLRPEIYVANDMTPNFLFTRSQTTDDRPADGRYRDVAAAAGCAVADNGQNEASMGIACADFDADGLTDIYLTHFYGQKNTLYRNLGGLLFSDESRRSRVAATSFDTLGFGTTAFDYDRDGFLDLFVANGHVLGPNHSVNELRPQLLANNGRGVFSEITAHAGPYFQGKYLGRGVAAADYDNDGDVDLVVTHLDAPVALLRNDTETPRRHFLGLALSTQNRIPPVGGRVTVTAGSLRVVSPLAAGGSYLCTSDARLLFGLGEWDGPVDVAILWPSGRQDTLELLPDRYWFLHASDGQDTLDVRPDGYGRVPGQWRNAEQ